MAALSSLSCMASAPTQGYLQRLLLASVYYLQLYLLHAHHHQGGRGRSHVLCEGREPYGLHPLFLFLLSLGHNQWGFQRVLGLVQESAPVSHRCVPSAGLIRLCFSGQWTLLEICIMDATQSMASANRSHVRQGQPLPSKSPTHSAVPSLLSLRLLSYLFFVLPLPFICHSSRENCWDEEETWSKSERPVALQLPPGGAGLFWRGEERTDAAQISAAAPADRDAGCAAEGLRHLREGGWQQLLHNRLELSPLLHLQHLLPLPALLGDGSGPGSPEAPGGSFGHVAGGGSADEHGAAPESDQMSRRRLALMGRTASIHYTAGSEGCSCDPV